MSWWQNLWEAKPFNQGYLPEVDEHRVYFAEYGNPKGKPVLVFHGGPGGSCRAKHVKKVGVSARVIMFDQRGCGKSLPTGETHYNETEDLVADANRLLNHLKIDQKVTLLGVSWGATLALLFAEKYPQKVERLLLSQIFLADKAALEWEIEGNGLFYPEFAEEMESEVRGWNDIRSFALRQIDAKNPAEQLEVMNHYGSWERLIGKLDPKWGKMTEVDEAVRASMKIYFHYTSNSFMLKDRQILKNISKIKDIPAVIVHNRLDFCCPPKGAYELRKALPKSRLIIVPEQGHGGDLLWKTVCHEFKKEMKNG